MISCTIVRDPNLTFDLSLKQDLSISSQKTFSAPLLFLPIFYACRRKKKNPDFMMFISFSETFFPNLREHGSVGNDRLHVVVIFKYIVSIAILSFPCVPLKSMEIIHHWEFRKMLLTTEQDTI